MRRVSICVAFVALALSGCGGGGGSSPSSSVPNAASTPAAGATIAATPTATATSVAVATATPSPSPTATTTSLLSAYQSAQWQNGTTVAFSGSCSMTLTSTGAPAFKLSYYLAPASTGQTVVATTASTGMQLALIPVPSAQTAVSQTFNICPTKASTTTATSGGPIGYMLTGEALFNPYEASGTIGALSDNASYTFTSNGTTQTAYFIDTCNSHSTNLGGSVVWHFHAVPTCLTSTVDGATGPSHIIGVALDGYPIYGGRDVNGNIVSTSSLDSCNGITSPTPEFPNGVYHYVLPINVTNNQSSLRCYTGTVSASVAEKALQYLCGLEHLNAKQRAAVLAELRRKYAMLDRQPSPRG
jgi:hypothetical protein